jgi:hypothetical protein
MSLFDNLSITAANAAYDASFEYGMGKVRDWISRGFGASQDTLHFYYDYSRGGSVLEVIAKKAALGVAQVLKNEALEQYKKLIGLNKKKVTLAKSDTSRSIIIENTYKNQQKRYGYIKVNDGKVTVPALDPYGNVCTEALMLSIPVKPNINLTIQRVSKNGTESDGSSQLVSDHLVWYDCTAIVTVDSDKNYVLTKVVGRDYTRKELVSNGDFNFSVSGHLLSNTPDVMPSEEIKKFTQIMRYKGVVEVNSEVLDQFNVKKLLITNFNISPQEGDKSNIPYTFNAVGIQPAEEIKMREDTITTFDNALTSASSSTTTKTKWQQMIDDKLDGLKTNSVSIVDQGLTLSTGLLNQL